LIALDLPQATPPVTTARRLLALSPPVAEGDPDDRLGSDMMGIAELPMVHVAVMLRNG
jgi:hypothetical protein